MSDSNTSALKTIYDERSSTYDDSHHVDLAADFLDWAELREGESVLDLACGTGLVTIPAKRITGRRGRVVGIDISTGMLEIARRKAKAMTTEREEGEQQGLEIEFYAHDITRLDELDLFPRDAQTEQVGFDKVVCCSALLLLPQPLAALRHWVSFMAPRARLVTDMPAKYASLPIHIFGQLERELGMALEYDASWAETGDPLRRLLSDAGLVVDRVFTSKTYASSAYSIDQGSELFATVVKSPMFRKFGEAEVRDRAEALFVDCFRQLAGEDGMVRQDVRMHIGIAHKEG